MQTGEVVGGRFEIVRPAGSGGMGEVFQAIDRLTGDLVAVKVLLDDRASDRARFEREAEALSELRHPGIVQYVAHGETASGEPYLVMEWLEGEDLASRLKHGKLTVEESVTLGLRVAEPLGAAHARGIVHRDLKPSNLFLVEGSVERVKVLDFGIAWLADTTRMTASGIVLGTPGYMAPEQARSGAELDARADVFSLGCVLFECLTGERAFVGEHVMALLAKILFEEVPRLRELEPAVPAGLDALVARMLAKDRAKRPRHGLDVAEVLSALDTSAWSALPSARSAPSSAGAPALTAGERRLLSVVLVGRAQPLGVGSTQTLGKTDMDTTLFSMRRMTEARGGKLDLLVDGSVLVTLVGTGIATDLAARAARCALALRALAEGRPIALAMGRGEVTGKLPLGDAIERAARRLHGASVSPEAIAIDAMTAGLLDGRFEVKAGDRGPELHGERELSAGVRTLLGKPTPCVGRDRELATLRALFDECLEESVARVAMVTAGPGIGKSRLAYELIQEIKARGGEPQVEIWMGRGDSLRAGSSFSVLGQVLRGAADIREGEPLPARQEKLLARVARRVAPTAQRRVAEFLGEIVDTPFPDEESAPLRAARQDALLMGEQMRRAWEDFLEAECAARPILLVLDDLHWGDLPTVRCISAALGSLKALPWMVLALARPEIHEIFPRLWVERDAQQIRLDQLSRRAGERLVRQVLGPAVGAETVEHVVAMADGNAFYLEELIRAVAEGTGGALPETVVAMVEARLQGLEADARRVLRAASIFGEVFWRGGVQALLGGAWRGPQVGQWLSLLVDREVLTPRQDSRFPGDVEFAFRHALLREGAYAMLTEEDRALGHKLAAGFLEERGEGDPMMLAEHCERGQELARAGAHYLRAAEQAMRGGDTEAAIARAERGLALGVAGAERAALLGLLCEAYVWRNQARAAVPYADEVMRIAPPGSVPWAWAISIKIGHARARGEADEIVETVRALQGIEPSGDAATALALTLSLATSFLDAMGRHLSAELVLAQLTAIAAPRAAGDPVLRGWFNLIQTLRGAWVKEDPGGALERAMAGYASFMEANHTHGRLIASMAIGMLAWGIGALDQAERALRDTMVADEEFGQLSSLRCFCLVGVLADRGALAEGLREAERLIDLGQRSRGPVYEAHGRWGLAEVLRRKGQLERAEGEARVSARLLTGRPEEQPAAIATLAAILLARGRVEEALARAEEAIAMIDAASVFGFRGAFIRLIHVEALVAAGDRPRAERALVALTARLTAQAGRIKDPELRRHFLEDVPENARAFALSRALG